MTDEHVVEKIRPFEKARRNMKKIFAFFLLLGVLAVPLCASDWDTTGKGGRGGQLSPEIAEKAWMEFPAYQPGTDAGVLLTMDWVVIDAMAHPETRQKTAARLAALLGAPKTTPQAKKFICAKLYQIGTEAEIPAVIPLLSDADSVDDARLFLERIGTESARQALREAAETLSGRPFIGVVNSLSLLQDGPAFEKIVSLTASGDPEVVRAAWRALGNYGSEEAGRFFLERLTAERKANIWLESAAVRCAILLRENGNVTLSEAVLDQLTCTFRSLAGRKAGWKARWDLFPSALKNDMAQEWIDSEDPVKKNLALSLLAPKLEAERENKPMEIWFREMMGQNEMLAREAEIWFASQPKEKVGPFLLGKMKAEKVPSVKIVDLLAKLKFYDAIDPLVELAKQKDPECWSVALRGLRGVCDPDDFDLRRMLRLYLEVQDPVQKDLVSRTTAAIAEKNPNAETRADVLLVLIDAEPEKDSAEFQIQVLPLLGRLGTAKVFALVEKSMNSENADIQEAAWLALCNWPNAEHAALLWKRAETGDPAALRAFIRVITIPSERPAAEVFADLKRAFEKAVVPEDRLLAVERAKAVRTLEIVQWLAEMLDDEVLAQTACVSIVELAHHRFLRQPNKAVFDPILQKVKDVSQSEEIRQRAEKARLGM